MTHPSDDHRFSTRDRILAAAAEEFAEHGFEGARVDEIADRAAVNKAMLYYHVGDKAVLYREVLVRNFDQVLAGVEDKLAEATTPEERLRAFVDALAHGAATAEHHPQIMLREIASGGAHLDPETLQRTVAAMEHLMTILRDGVETGCFRPTDPLMTHFTLVGSVVFSTAVAAMLRRFTTYAPETITHSPMFTQEQLADHVYSIFTQGLFGGRE